MIYVELKILNRCIEGYYGDPSLAGEIPCRPCPCPGTLESGHSYAKRCKLDPLSQDVECDCEEEYAGWQTNPACYLVYDQQL